jgi:endonuclease YncB( thermonuclease family)
MGLLVSFLPMYFIFAHGAEGNDQRLKPSDLAFTGQSLVTTVIDGDTLTLGDNRDVRLTGIQAPKIPLGRWFCSRRARSS